MFCMSTMKTWCGDITDLRIDNMVRTPVEIAEIAFMTYTEPAGGDRLSMSAARSCVLRSVPILRMTGS